MEVLEHLKFTFYVDGITRDTLQELARHDVGVAMTVRGTRFENDSNIMLITIPKEVLADAPLLDKWLALWNMSREVYQETKDKYGNDVAKGSLLGALQVRLYISFDLLALMRFLSQRMCNKAYFDIQELADHLYEIMEPKFPMVVGEFSGTPCKVDKCRESRPCKNHYKKEK